MKPFSDEGLMVNELNPLIEAAFDAKFGHLKGTLAYYSASLDLGAPASNDLHDLIIEEFAKGMAEVMDKMAADGWED